jgi:hypothetical protein
MLNNGHEDFSVGIVKTASGWNSPFVPGRFFMGTLAFSFVLI